MPITILSTPNSVDLSMTVFMAGIRISQPSRPKRFSEDHLRERNDSNLEKYNNNQQTELCNLITNVYFIVLLESF